MADTDPTSSVPAAAAVSTTPRPSDTQLDTDTVASTPSPAKWAPEDMPTPGDAKRDRARGLEDDLLIPPLNFGRVCRGVYRSGFPGKKNFSFLKKLGLHTVLNLSEHEYPKETKLILAENKSEALVQVLQATADRPVLIHCTKGTHRTGCVVGCLRKLEQWSLTSIFDEYQRYAGKGGAPHLDQQFIEFFAPTEQHRELAKKRELFD